MKRTPAKPPTLSDVARLAGVGNGTASRVLNGGDNCSPETVLRVEDAIRKLGFIPNRLARSLKGGKSGTIGMIVPSISDMFFSQCAEAVETVAKRNNSLLIVMASHDDETIERSNLRLLLLHRIDGLILAPATSSPSLHRELKAMTIPAVGLDRPLQPRLPSVLSEHREGAIAATRHLLAHHYKKILCIHVNPDLYTIQERLAGYRYAMTEAGMTPILEGVQTAADVERCLEKHRAPSKHRDKSPQPIAIFAANNLAARLTWEAIRSLGLAIPQQVALLGFDDFDLSDSLTPPMSVVRQTIEDLGTRSAELLFLLMKKPADSAKAIPTGPIRLPTTLVLRQSCGCKPAPPTPASSKPAQTGPAPNKPVPNKPVPTRPALKTPVSTGPAPKTPVSTSPVPTTPAPKTRVSTSPVPTSPVATRSVPTSPVATKSVPTRPAATKSVPTRPAASKLARLKHR